MGNPLELLATVSLKTEKMLMSLVGNSFFPTDVKGACMGLASKTDIWEKGLPDFSGVVFTCCLDMGKSLVFSRGKGCSFNGMRKQDALPSWVKVLLFNTLKNCCNGQYFSGLCHSVEQ